MAEEEEQLQTAGVAEWETDGGRGDRMEAAAAEIARGASPGTAEAPEAAAKCGMAGTAASPETVAASAQ
jgi:hypothetical protein